MAPRPTEHAPTAEAVEFVRFCYRRRRVGWPDLYDEMWAVAGRGLFRGWGAEDLEAAGIGFCLTDLPALASLVRQVVAEEVDQRARAGPALVVSRSRPAEPAPASGSTAREPQPQAAPVVA